MKWNPFIWFSDNAVCQLFAHGQENTYFNFNFNFILIVIANKKWKSTETFINKLSLLVIGMWHMGTVKNKT